MRQTFVIVLTLLFAVSCSANSEWDRELAENACLARVKSKVARKTGASCSGTGGGGVYYLKSLWLQFHATRPLTRDEAMHDFIFMMETFAHEARTDEKLKQFLRDPISHRITRVDYYYTLSGTLAEESISMRGKDRAVIKTYPGIFEIADVVEFDYVELRDSVLNGRSIEEFLAS